MTLNVSLYYAPVGIIRMAPRDGHLLIALAFHRQRLAFAFSRPRCADPHKISWPVRKRIYRTTHTGRAEVENVGVDHRRLDGEQSVNVGKSVMLSPAVELDLSNIGVTLIGCLVAEVPGFCVG